MDEINKIVDKYTAKEPIYNFIADKVTHMVWKIDKEEDIKALVDQFEAVKVYI